MSSASTQCAEPPWYTYCVPGAYSSSQLARTAPGDARGLLLPRLPSVPSGSRTSSGTPARRSPRLFRACRTRVRSRRRAGRRRAAPRRSSARWPTRRSASSPTRHRNGSRRRRRRTTRSRRRPRHAPTATWHAASPSAISCSAAARSAETSMSLLTGHPRSAVAGTRGTLLRLHLTPRHVGPRVSPTTHPTPRRRTRRQVRRSAR